MPLQMLLIVPVYCDPVLSQPIPRCASLSLSLAASLLGRIHSLHSCGVPLVNLHSGLCRSTLYGITYEVPEDEFTINLKSISPDKFRLSSFERQTINHECMHLLAFVHEHQAPERSKHFSFDRSKVHEAYGRDGISAEQIEFNIMDLHPPEALENYSPFDLDSVTLYQFPGYIMQNGGATNANKNLSDTDKAVLVLNYARLDPGPLVSEWTVAHAADVIGIKGEWREKIVAATHPQDIRRLYSDWSKSPQRDQQGEA
ncbi:hypothetical protein NLI96_g12361 [Meripilus lineatus]|uniref:Peptidase M12A domain-containing protein n=1 Tax=Meripilus lineatus TaxID=2056292 RepID=A0AAD5UQ04_9APHY|nr:hypothetical protein NLI96_g12361 [Physisporinus lineatus]